MGRKRFTPRGVIHPRARWQWWCRNIILKDTRKRLENQNFSIISCNCLGAMITHDLLQPQLSPTVNLFFNADDFLRFVSNLDYYLDKELIEIHVEGCNYPVGKLDDVIVWFMHYKTFEDAKNKWEERVKRINRNNLFVFFSEREGCTYDHLLAFDRLPYRNKIVFTHIPYPEIKSAYYFKGYEDKNMVGDITDFDGLWGKRIYDRWDYVSFLNDGFGSTNAI